jgi:hypothetical protein
MQNRDTNSINMIRATILWCTNNTSATATIPVFATHLATIQNKLSLIDEYTQTALKSTKGVTTDTKNIRATMQLIAHKCASALSAYAATQKNNTLRAKVNYTLNNMSAKKKEEIDDICQTIHYEATIHLSVASGFGYAQTDLNDLQQAITLYRIRMQDPRQAIITRIQALQSLRAQLKEIKTILFKQILDSMVNTLRLSNPEFVRGYFQSRTIIDLGSTTAKLRGTIKSTNQHPLINATITIINPQTAEIIAQTQTNLTGKFGIYKIPAATYTIQYTHPTHQTHIETNIRIAPGKELKRKITLIPL